MVNGQWKKTNGSLQVVVELKGREEEGMLWTTLRRWV